MQQRQRPAQRARIHLPRGGGLAHRAERQAAAKQLAAHARDRAQRPHRDRDQRRAERLIRLQRGLHQRQHVGARLWHHRDLAHVRAQPLHERQPPHDLRALRRFFKVVAGADERHARVVRACRNPGKRRLADAQLAVERVGQGVLKRHQAAQQRLIGVRIRQTRAAVARRAQCEEQRHIRRGSAHRADHRRSLRRRGHRQEAVRAQLDHLCARQSGRMRKCTERPLVPAHHRHAHRRPPRAQRQLPPAHRLLLHVRPPAHSVRPFSAITPAYQRAESLIVRFCVA